MPESSRRSVRDSRSAKSSIDLEVPAWLAEAVAPWRVDAAALVESGGVRLELRSKRSRVPVLVELPEAGGALAMSILDPRVSPRLARSFVQALGKSLRQHPRTRAWLGQLGELARRLRGESSGTAGGDEHLAALIEAWRIWPARDSDPTRQIPELPRVVAELELSREARAATILHRFARAEVLEGLSEWAELPKVSEDASFVELLAEAAALGIVGRREHAGAALERASEAASDEQAWLAIARAYEGLDMRESALAAHERVVALRGTAWDRLRLARVRGDFAPGEAIPRPDERASAGEKCSFVRQVIKVLDAAGRHDDGLVLIGELLDELPAPPPPDLAMRAAQLHLWRVEGEQARAGLAALAGAVDDGRVELIEGALAVLEGRPAEGLKILDEAETSGTATALEVLLWKAEAHLALDQPEQALACVDEHIIRENTLVAYLLKLLCVAKLKSVEELGRSIESRTFLDGLVLDVLPSLCEPEALAAARADPSQLAGLVRALLDDMGGNRGAKATWCQRGESGTRLERVRVRPSGREAAVDNLVRIRSEPPELVLAGFEEVAREYAISPHPWTYRGELLIWLGRYEDALVSFEQADTRAPTRWSYVGRAAAYDLLGRAEEADHWTAEGAKRFGELETATTHVYRGERLRKLERWDAAKRDLDIALAVKQRRIGARINLALVHRAFDEDEAWAREVERIRRDAPAYVFEAGGRAGRELDPELLTTMLELMVGNRSSFLHTMIAEGEFRVVPDPGRWVAHARLCLALGRAALGREISRRMLPGRGEPRAL
jgi:tetratricopeptide (TPR) repeat protein